MPSSAITDYLPPGRPSAPRRRPDAAPSPPPRPKPRPTAGSSALSKSQTSAQAPSPAPASSLTPSARQRRPQQAATGSRTSASASLPDSVLGSSQNPISLLSPVMASTALPASAASRSRLALSQSSHAALGDANGGAVDVQDEERARATTDSPDPPSPSEIIAAYRGKSSISATSQQQRESVTLASQQPASGGPTDSQQARSICNAASQQQASSSMAGASPQQQRRLGVSNTSQRRSSLSSATNGNSGIHRASTGPSARSAQASRPGTKPAGCPPWLACDNDLLCALVKREGPFWKQIEPAFNVSSVHMRTKESLRRQWTALTCQLDRTPQITAAMQAAATFADAGADGSLLRSNGWTKAELQVLHEGLAQDKGSTAIYRDFVARFTASKRTLGAVRHKLDRVTKAVGRGDDEEQEVEESEEDDAQEVEESEEDDAQEVGESEEDDASDNELQEGRGDDGNSEDVDMTSAINCPAAQGPAEAPQSSSQVPSGPSVSATSMQRAAAAAHSLGYGRTVSRSRREAVRTSTSPPTSSHKRKRRERQQRASSWTAQEDRVLLACTAGGPGGWASLKEMRRSYFAAFPLSTRTDKALKVRRSFLHVERGCHVRHISGGEEEEEEESDEDNPGDEDSDEGINARQEEGEVEGQGERQGIAYDREEVSASGSDEEVENEREGEGDNLGGEAVMDGLPATVDQVMQTGSGKQLLPSRMTQRPVETAHDEEGYAFELDESQAMEANNQFKQHLCPRHRRPASRTTTFGCIARRGVAFAPIGSLSADSAGGALPSCGRGALQRSDGSPALVRAQRRAGQGVRSRHGSHGLRPWLRLDVYARRNNGHYTTIHGPPAFPFQDIRARASAAGEVAA